jgi:hypothetical protein
MLASAGFSQDSSLISRIIRKLTGAPCSHAFLIVAVAEFGREMVLEASAFGIRMISLERFLSRNTLVARFDFGAKLEPGLREAATWLGETYDFGGLLGMALVLVGRWLRKKWINPLHRAHSLFCSELVTQVLQTSSAGGVAVAALVPEDTSPGDLLAALKSTARRLEHQKPL